MRLIRLVRCQCGFLGIEPYRFRVKIRHLRYKASCPLYPRKRTLELSRGMSALCQKRTRAVQQKNTATDFYVRAMAIFEVMLALTFPSLRSGPRCASIAAFSLSCVPAGNVARDGASGVAASALVACAIPPSKINGRVALLTRIS